MPPPYMEISIATNISQLMLFLLLLFSVPAVHLGDLQDGQPDLVVAPGHCPSAPRARDTAVRLTAATPVDVRWSSFVILG